MVTGNSLGRRARVRWVSTSLVALLVSNWAQAAEAPPPPAEPEVSTPAPAGSRAAAEKANPVAASPPSDPSSARTAPAGGGFTLTSGDGNHTLKLRGYVHADARYYLRDPNRSAADNFLLRRVRPQFDATFFKRFDLRLLPDFGEGKAVVQDAYLDARITAALRVRAGKFKAPVGLERLQSVTASSFTELGLPTSLVPNRDVGIQLHGELLGKAVAYALGVFDGAVDGGSADADSADGKEGAARLFVHPFRLTGLTALHGLGFGVAGTYGKPGGKTDVPNLPSFKSAGQQTFFKYRAGTAAADTVVADGALGRVAPQAYFAWGPAGVLAEYVLSSQRVRLDQSRHTVRNRAFQVAATAVLFGGKASFEGVKPQAAVGAGGWGALEAVLRYGELRVDRGAFPLLADPAKSARRAREVEGGFNWYLNDNLKLVADLERTTFVGGASKGDRAPELALLSRLQVAW